jgi:hypothetical protein
VLYIETMGRKIELRFRNPGCISEMLVVTKINCSPAENPENKAEPFLT